MKKILLLLVLIVTGEAVQAQFKYTDGKAIANMDTLGTRNDTLFLKNRVTGEVAFFVAENNETITTREKVAAQISDSLAQHTLTENDPIYSGDSAYLKSNIRSLKLVTDTAAEWVSRTIYVSMPTDPQTPGSDVTGNGTSITPFETINKALKSIKKIMAGIITIQLDSGLFYFTETDKDLLIDIINKSNIYAATVGFPVDIKGKYIKENYVFSLLSTVVPFEGIISGYSFTNNELNNKFVGNTISPLFPIESNFNDTIIIPISAFTSYNNIYRFETQISFQSNSLVLKSDKQVSFKYSNLSFAGGNYFNGINIDYCIVTNQSTSSGFFNIQNATITRTKFNVRSNISTANVILGINTTLSNSIIYNEGTRKTTNSALYNASIANISNNIMSGFLNAIRTNSAIPNLIATAPNILYIKDCINSFSNQSNPGAPLSFSCTSLCLKNTDYIFYTHSNNAAVAFVTVNVYGLRTLYNPSSLYKDFVNTSLGGYISGLGLYTEYQQNQTNTLLNNTTDSISIGDKSYNRSIRLEYTITRGTGVRTGTLKITNFNNTLFFDAGDYFPADDLGVSFTGTHYSGSSNTIKLRYSVSNTGDNASITYDAFRQNY